MSTYAILILMSILVIFSYLFDLFARRTKVPSVILLLLTGIGLHYGSVYLGIAIVDFSEILPLLGNLGLILIVLEGALELRFEQRKLKLIKKSFGAAFFILVFTTLSIAFLFQYFSQADFHRCLMNAIPYSVISSAIAIPSVANLGKSKKEFIIYESSLSDILGIVFFNFVEKNNTFDFNAFLTLTWDTFLVLIISLVFCLFLLYLLGRIQHNVKFFLVISILILIFAIGKQIHLSSLVTILAFGLFLNNTDLIEYPLFTNFFMYSKLKHDLHQLVQLTAESAFIVRTFFFLMFGYIMDINSLIDLDMLAIGGLILLITYLIRYLYIRLVAKISVMPELVICPRGLISILLFSLIPESMRLSILGDGLLFFIILSTSILMTVGLVGYKPKPEVELR
ncbi:MAG: cation:proton antiporter [Thermonemataceae bacterium]